MNSAAMIHGPHRTRTRGTESRTPTVRWTWSESQARGQTAHQKRPATTKESGSSGHQTVQASAIPKF